MPVFSPFWRLISQPKDFIGIYTQNKKKSHCPCFLSSDQSAQQFGFKLSSIPDTNTLHHQWVLIEKMDFIPNIWVTSKS